MRRQPPWTRDLRASREARRLARLAYRMESMERHERKRWRGPHPLGIVVAMALVQVLGTRAAAYGTTGTEVLDRTGYLLLLAGPLALLVRERWPLVSLVGALVPTAAYFSLGYPDGPGFVAAIVAMFTALASGYRWLTWAAVAAAFSVFAVLVRGDESASRVVLIGVWCLVIAGFGEAARVRGMRYSQMARDWSAQQQLARAEEEKARVEQARRQASDERLLIARELHDVIGHHLSLINVQAGVGLHLMDEQPEQARVALTAIKHASAEALRETRSVLAGLNPGEAAPRTPAPGLRDLDRLVEEARAVGLPVTVDTVGEPGPLPPQVDRAAFRIVQEALTNVRRHAGPGAAATIVVGYAPGELTIHVTDDGRGAATGHLDDAHPPVAVAAGPGPATTGPEPAGSSAGADAGRGAAGGGGVPLGAAGVPLGAVVCLTAAGSAATGSPACATGPPPSAAWSRPARAPAVVSRSVPGFPFARSSHDHTPHRSQQP
ncbi:histidine kinase [Dactylosporangium sp. NBC_01737]|uniref:sensor histidine kinase n=1 Tax=Dactylosporangium sp. NBC_01737 TaxID=2975959 RepID=UPI002E13C463|nr:histidine kinase [Dactylosporangium sp. NBC_01737]